MTQALAHYSLIAFDAYGTLFDVYSITELAEELFPNQGQALTLMWRERQIEYTRLISLSDPSPQGSKHYIPFWDVTILSLRYCCKRLGLSLTPAKEEKLMAQYAKLKAFADSKPTLQNIKEKGTPTAILSNGSVDMLSTVVQSNGLNPLLDNIVSVEPARIFKTAPQAYQLLCTTFGVSAEKILFVSSNAWDALAASWFGFDVFWVNRQGLPFEEIGPLPKYSGSSLNDLLKIL
jgi:2-haloacid dehalogenase